LKRALDQGFVELFLAGGPPCRALLWVNAHGGMISLTAPCSSRAGAAP
jgi:hypothetical protein